MLEAVPDVVEDTVTDAAKRLGVRFIEQVFYKAAEEAGFTNPQDIARCRFNQWARHGYASLPPYLKDFCLRACSGEVH